MSDSLATRDALTAPSQDGQAQQVSTPAQAPASRPSTGQADENIRKLQSTYDRKLAEKDRVYQQQLAQSDQRIRAMQNQLNQMQEAAAPDDFARLELRLQRAEQEKQEYANAYQNALRAQQTERQFQEAMQRISAKFEISKRELEDAVREAGVNDYEEAVYLATEIKQKKAKAKQQQDNDRRERNMPDVGASAPTTAQSQWERDYAEAQKNRDTLTMMRLLRTKET